MKVKFLTSVLILSLIGLIGIPNVNSVEIFPTLIKLASLDSDKDGYSDLCEYLHKTDPNDKESIPSSNIIINVPSDVKTIQEAINLAIDGDTILVAQGKYRGNINFKGKSITLTSTDPQNSDVVAKTIIEGTEKGSVITIDSNSVLRGFTITSGNIDCRGIYIPNASPTIENCTIIDNQTTSYGGGIYNDDSSPKITTCIIIKNSAKAKGGGIYNTTSSSPQITNSTISENTDSTTSESAQIAGAGTPEISQSWINGNGLVDNSNEASNVSEEEQTTTAAEETITTTADEESSDQTTTPTPETPTTPPETTTSEPINPPIEPSSPTPESEILEQDVCTTGAITNCDDLQAIRECPSRDFYLANDIDCSCTRKWNWDGDKYLGFEPIGDSNNPFTGTFDGKGHTITGLYINFSDIGDVGLFGYSGGEIKNVGLKNVDITGTTYVGGLVGVNNNNGTVTNSYVGTASNVRGYYRIGGLIGLNRGTVEKCYSTSNVTAYCPQPSSGPIVESCVGGLIGYNDGVVMNGNLGIVINSYARGDVSGIAYYAGGFIGMMYGKDTIMNCYSTGLVQVTLSEPDGQIGGFEGVLGCSECCSGCFGDIEPVGRKWWEAYSFCATKKTTLQMKTKETFTNAGWDFTNVWNIDPTKNDGYPYLREVGVAPVWWFVDDNALPGGDGRRWTTAFRYLHRMLLIIHMWHLVMRLV